MSNNINVLIENKNEYLNYLIDNISIPICRFFVNISDNCNTLKNFRKN